MACRDTGRAGSEGSITQESTRESPLRSDADEPGRSARREAGGAFELRFGQSVVAGVADAADRRLDADLEGRPERIRRGTADLLDRCERMTEGAVPR